MKRIRFLAKCILASIPAIALIAYTLLCPFCYMDEEYPAWTYTKHVAEGKECAGEDFDTVILGDSVAMSSIMPALMDGSCVNLAVGGATSIEMYYYMEEYLKNHQAPQTALILFGPFHYWHIDNYETRTLYFKAVPFSKLSELYENARLCGASSVWRKGAVTGEISARCGLPNKYLPAITAARFTGRYDINKAAYRDLQASLGWGSFGEQNECYDESYETSYEDMEIDGDARLITLYMQKLLRLCADEGIHVKLLQPAVNTATFDNLNEHYYGSYRNYIKQISTVCPGMEYETDLRSYDGKYFSDTSHLNRAGAEKYTKEIVKRDRVIR
ncbi:MAG: hypothetical protein K6F28_00705 [Lachnospiraceae bacterium]|nr:hypothetical protein [Lachnospiraceae bacterium]